MNEWTYRWVRFRLVVCRAVELYEAYIHGASLVLLDGLAMSVAGGGSGGDDAEQHRVAAIRRDCVCFLMRAFLVAPSSLFSLSPFVWEFGSNLQ